MRSDHVELKLNQHELNQHVLLINRSIHPYKEDPAQCHNTSVVQVMKPHKGSWKSRKSAKSDHRSRQHSLDHDEFNALPPSQPISGAQIPNNEEEKKK